MVTIGRNENRDRTRGDNLESRIDEFHSYPRGMGKKSVTKIESRSLLDVKTRLLFAGNGYTLGSRSYLSLSLSLSLPLSPSSLSRSCVVTVEPLSRQQVGLLGTQRGWPPGSTDTTITVITTTSARADREREQRQRGNTVNRSASLPASSSFFLSNLPRRTAAPRLTSPIITNNY